MFALQVVGLWLRRTQDATTLPVGVECKSLESDLISLVPNYFDYLGTFATAVEKTSQAEWVAIPAHDGSSDSSLVQFFS